MHPQLSRICRIKIVAFDTRRAAAAKSRNEGCAAARTVARQGLKLDEHGVIHRDKYHYIIDSDSLHHCAPKRLNFQRDILLFRRGD